MRKTPKSKFQNGLKRNQILFLSVRVIFCNLRQSLRSGYELPFAKEKSFRSGIWESFGGFFYERFLHEERVGAAKQKRREKFRHKNRFTFAPANQQTLLWPDFASYDHNHNDDDSDDPPNHLGHQDDDEDDYEGSGGEQINSCSRGCLKNTEHGPTNNYIRVIVIIIIVVIAVIIVVIFIIVGTTIIVFQTPSSLLITMIMIILQCGSQERKTNDSMQ